MIKSFRGVEPELRSGAVISETSIVIGNVVLEENSNIWYGAVLRGDMNKIMIGRNTNIQENCVIHVDLNDDVFIGPGCTVGHGAIIHGCKIGENTLIGMGSIILNGAEIGNNSIVGAGSLITQNKRFEDGMLILGNPARAIRKLTQDEIESNKKACKNYVEISKEI